MEISVMPVERSSGGWEALAAFADDCSWRAGAFLARDMRTGAFDGWERVFAARCGEVFAGFCTLARTDCIEGLPYTPWIGYVFVTEAFRGKRISERLIEAAAEYARSLGFGAVYLISDHAGLYEKYGFEAIERQRAPWGAMETVFRRRI